MGPPLPVQSYVFALFQRQMLKESCLLLLPLLSQLELGVLSQVVANGNRVQLSRLNEADQDVLRNVRVVDDLVGVHEQCQGVLSGRKLEGEVFEDVADQHEVVVRSEGVQLPLLVQRERDRVPFSLQPLGSGRDGVVVDELFEGRVVGLVLRDVLVTVQNEVAALILEGTRRVQNLQQDGCSSLQGLDRFGNLEVNELIEIRPVNCLDRLSHL